MENLSNKTIKQYYFKTKYGTIVITALINKETKFVDYWALLGGYGVMEYMFGIYYNNQLEIKHYAVQAEIDYIPTVKNVINDELIDYIDGKPVDENMKKALVKMQADFSDMKVNKARMGKD